MDLSNCYELLYDGKDMLGEVATEAEFLCSLENILPLTIAMCNQQYLLISLFMRF